MSDGLEAATQGGCEVSRVMVFDPGRSTPESYLQKYVNNNVGVASPTCAAVLEFASRLGDECQTSTWPAVERCRQAWTPPSPFPCSGSEIAADPGLVRANYDSWILTTAAECPLLHTQAVIDSLGSDVTTPRDTAPPGSSLRPNQEERISQERQVAADLLRTTPPYWGPLTSEQLGALEDTFSEAFLLASKEYGIEEAIAIGNNFRIPTALLTRDLKNLVGCEGSLRQLAAQVMIERSSQRISVERIDAVLNRPDLQGRYPRDSLTVESTLDAIRLARLAAGGIPIPRYPGFVPNNRPPRHKHTYRQVYEALNATLVQLWEHCLVFFLPTSCLLALGGIHFTPVGWTTKPGKKAGRYLFDARSKSAGTPLNCYEDGHLDDLRAEWGTLTLPTIHSLAQQILQFEDSHRSALGESFDPASLILLKGDLSKAFTLLSFTPDSVELTASELYQPSWEPLTPEQADLCATLSQQLRSSDPPMQVPPTTTSWSFLYHTGSFGLRLLPFVFGVVSRFLIFLVSAAIFGRINAYVDDFMAVTTRQHLAHDQAVIAEIVTLLLGPHSIEWSKWYAGRQGEWIGWRIDLDTRRVSLGRRNLLKVLYGFFNFDTSRHIQARHLLRLASWASRYTTVLRMLAPFTTYLYTQTNGMRNLEAFIPLQFATRVSIWVWRAALLQLLLQESDYSRPLDSFRTDDAHYLLEFDSSLEGSGLLLYTLENRDDPIQLASLCGQWSFPFNCQRDSSYQNTCELIPVALGCLALGLRGIRHIRLALKGDSTTALAWGATGRFSGDLVTRTAVVLTILSVQFDYVIVDAQHIPGEENLVCDALSRNTTTPVELGYSPSEIISNLSGTPSMELLHLCDPTLPSPFTSETTFNDFWFQVREFATRMDLASDLNH